MGQLNQQELDEIKLHIEDNWRQFLKFAAEGNQALGIEVITRFAEKAEKHAQTLPVEKGQAYLAAVEDARNAMFDEYTANPEALKKRLHVAQVSRVNPAPPVRQQQSIGEVAVKTAVRAGVWAAIWNLFR